MKEKERQVIRTKRNLKEDYVRSIGPSKDMGKAPRPDKGFSVFPRKYHCSEMGLSRLSFSSSFPSSENDLILIVKAIFRAG